MHRRRLLCALAGVSALPLTGCVTPTRSATRSPTPSGFPEVGTPPSIDAPTDPFVRGNVDFGLALQQRLADEEPDANRFISPYSIAVALGIAYAGARRATREEMAEALRYRPGDEGLHRAVAALRSALPLGDTSGTPTPTPTPTETTTEGSGGGDNGRPFRLLGANAAWAQVEFPFSQAYVDLLEQFYAVGLGTVDFESNHRAARRRINAWVGDRTRGEIPELFPPGSLSNLTRLVLTNAVYFRANWADTFAEENTEPGPFTALDGSTTAVPMMRESVEVPYAEVGGHQVAQLPYAGADVDMVVLLPPEGEFRAFERSLDAARLEELIAATESREGDLIFPRLEDRSSLSLPEYLEAMGMKRAFSGGADFSGMLAQGADARLKLDDVRHEATVTVDEQGTEAAAATGVEVVLVSATTNPFELVVDRPFLFAIRHRPTGAVLFLGRVVDAGAAQG